MKPGYQRQWSKAEIAAIIAQNVDWPPPPRPIPVVLGGLSPDDYRLTPFALFGTGREETSDNWSGIAIKADTDESFDVISCNMQMPKLYPPHSPSATAPALGSPGKAPNALAVSTWIGFDGLLGTSNSMPQIGITQSFKWTADPKYPGDPSLGSWQKEISAWWQWWLRDTTTDINPVTLTITEGDIVNCTLTRTSPYTATGLMTNGSQSSGKILLYPDQSKNPDPSLGRTAEWIAERPMKPVKYLPHRPKPDLWCKLYPLPQFDWVQFSECQATVASIDGSSSVRGVLPSRCLRMIEALVGPPSRSVVHSRAMVDGPNSFRVGPNVGVTWPSP